MSHSIYGLYDPTDETKLIRYVGYSSKSIDRRICEHVAESKARVSCHRHKWIRSLIRKGVKPAFVKIEAVTADNWQSRETFWIAFYQGQLVNSTSGGEGLINPSEEVRSRISKATKGKNIGNKHRQGIPHDDKSRMAISNGLANSSKKRAADDARRGKPGHRISEESKRKISEANKGRRRPDASRLVAEMNANRVGSFWVTNGLDSKQVKQSSDIPYGWRKGRVSPSDESKEKASKSIKLAAGKIYTPERNLKIAASRTGGRWINNGISNAYIKAGENLPDGWIFGRAKKGT